MSRLSILAVLLGTLAALSVAAPAPDSGADTQAQDPCAAVAGKSFVPPAQALACLKSFPFDEALRQNVLTVVSRVFDFYTSEFYYLDSPAPFQDSTVDIRAEIARINATQYAVGTAPPSFEQGSDGLCRQIMISTATFTSLPRG